MTLASRWLYAGRVVTYRANKQLNKGKEREPEFIGIKDYTKKKSEKGPPSTNSYTQSDEVSKGPSPVNTLHSEGGRPPQGPPGRGSGGGGDPGRRPPGRPEPSDRRDPTQGNPPMRGGAGGPPGRGPPGGGPPGGGPPDGDPDRELSPSRQSTVGDGSPGDEQGSARMQSRTGEGQERSVHPGDEDIRFASGVVSMYGDSAEINQQYHPMMQHGVVWKVLGRTQRLRLPFASEGKDNVNSKTKVRYMLS